MATIKLNNGDMAYITGSIRTVDGIDEIWELISNELNTPLGSYIFDLTYGGNLGQYVDEPLTKEIRQKATEEATRIILKNSNVYSATVTDVEQNTGLGIHASITTSQGTKTGNIVIGG